MNIKQILLRLTENWPVKIICLVFAVFLSEFYRGNLLDKRYLIVPLTVVNDGPLTPAEQYPTKIKVTLWEKPSESVLSVKMILRHPSIYRILKPKGRTGFLSKLDCLER